MRRIMFTTGTVFIVVQFMMWAPHLTLGLAFIVAGALWGNK